MSEVHYFVETESPTGKNMKLGVDDKGRLYVNGELVLTEQRIKLEWWVNISVILGGFGAFIQGLIALCSLYN